MGAGNSKRLFIILKLIKIVVSKILIMMIILVILELSSDTCHSACPPNDGDNFSAKIRLALYFFIFMFW